MRARRVWSGAGQRQALPMDDLQAPTLPLRSRKKTADAIATSLLPGRRGAALSREPEVDWDGPLLEPQANSQILGAGLGVAARWEAPERRESGGEGAGYPWRRCLKLSGPPLLTAPHHGHLSWQPGRELVTLHVTPHCACRPSVERNNFRAACPRSLFFPLQPRPLDSATRPHARDRLAYCQITALLPVDVVLRYCGAQSKHQRIHKSWPSIFE